MSTSTTQESMNSKAGTIALIIGVAVVAILSITTINIIRDSNKRIDELRQAGTRSPVHQFVTEKYLSCKVEFLSPSRDECVARVMAVARARGAEYEAQVGAVVRELGLDK